jgi:hypothetical protein
MKTINLEKWRGKRDEVAIDPSTVEFAAVKRASCAGCAFEFQWSTTCEKAHHEAAKRSLPPCSDGYVYRTVERDPRQSDLITKE